MNPFTGAVRRRSVVVGIVTLADFSVVLSLNFQSALRALKGRDPLS